MNPAPRLPFYRQPLPKDLMSSQEPNRFSHETLLASLDRESVLTMSPIDLRALPDPRQAVRAMLENPVDFPSIASAIVPGDRITIVVDVSLPDLDGCVAGVLDSLTKHEECEISILLGEEASTRVVDRVKSVADQKADVLVHDPEDKDQLSYLAADENGNPIYLNRSLTDADFVLPMIIPRPTGALPPACNAGGIFPAFADRDSQQRIRDAFWQQASGDQAGCLALANEAMWLLGLQLVVNVMPTADGHAAEIVAGSPEGVSRKLLSHIESSWQRSATNPGDLIVAMIEGDEDQQSWDDIARAVHIASKLATPGGTIAISSAVSAPMGLALQQLASDETYESIQERLNESPQHDSTVANVLLRTRDEYRVLLGTQHRMQDLEQIGIGAFDSVESLEHLIKHSDSTVVVRGAQYCGILDGEGTAEEL